ncbi:MAG: gene transfer agent family protein [Gemmatimonadales bacterium]|nr:gene transfer agent family protein [Gemmatimonadales bacterium]
MSRSAAIDLDFADDTYRFRLGWGELEELQEKCNAGPQRILMRLASADWRIDDIRHTIRLGLIGGGVEPVKALKLVRAYVEARPPVESVTLALGVLQVALIGAPEERDAAPSGAGERIDDLPNGKIRFDKVLGAGAAMGFTPAETRAMSVYEFGAAARGVAEAHAPAASMSSKEADEVWEWMREHEGETVN